MKYVYILKSMLAEEHYYVGLTQDIDTRLNDHNSGSVSHTSKYRPWQLKSYVGFGDEAQAVKFEKYLKTASGRAFSKKRL